MREVAQLWRIEQEVETHVFHSVSRPLVDRPQLSECLSRPGRHAGSGRYFGPHPPHVCISQTSRAELDLKLGPITHFQSSFQVHQTALESEHRNLPGILLYGVAGAGPYPPHVCISQTSRAELDLKLGPITHFQSSFQVHQTALESERRN